MLDNYKDVSMLSPQNYTDYTAPKNSDQGKANQRLEFVRCEQTNSRPFAFPLYTLSGVS